MTDSLFTCVSEWHKERHIAPCPWCGGRWTRGDKARISAIRGLWPLRNDVTPARAQLRGLIRLARRGE